MKVAIITDTHYGARKGSKYLHDHFEMFYKNVFFPALKEHGVEAVIHMGDAFDSRKSIDYQSLEWAKRVVFDPLKDYEVHMIIGNHDTYYKNTNEVNSINILLNEYSNIIKISSPMEFRIGELDFLFLPWICADNQEESYSMIKSTKAKIVFGHLELNGFPVFPGQTQPNGIDKSIFSKFTRVFSGHYHTRSDDGKIFYLGNPYQMFWNDCNDVRGFNIFDTETLKLKHIPNTYNIFEKIYYKDSDLNELDKFDLRDKFVKLIVQNKKDQKQYDKFLDKILSMKPLDLKISEILDIDDSNYQYQDYDVEDTLSILNSYIEESEFDLDKKIAKQIIKDVYLEAMEVE